MKRKAPSNYIPRKDRVKRPRQKVSQGNAVARPVRYSRPMRVGEVKGLDTSIGLTPVIITTNTNGSIFVLNLIPPGTGSWNRVGRKCYLKSLRIKANATYQYAPFATTFNQAATFLRYIVVWDKQPSGGTIPSFDTIFGQTDQAGTESTTLLSPLKYDNMDRFQVLLDKRCDFNPASFASGGSVNAVGMSESIDEYIKLKGKECVYSGQSATQTIADISTGALYLIFRASQNTATSAVMTISTDSMARLRYTD